MQTQTQAEEKPSKEPTKADSQELEKHYAEAETNLRKAVKELSGQPDKEKAKTLLTEIHRNALLMLFYGGPLGKSADEPLKIMHSEPANQSA